MLFDILNKAKDLLANGRFTGNLVQNANRCLGIARHDKILSKKL